MHWSGYLSLLVLPFIVLPIQSSANETLSIAGNRWSCPFDTDLCGWNVGAVESLHPAGPLVDIGWRIFSPHAGDELNPSLNVSTMPRFAYLDSLAELRSELTSPAQNLTEEHQRAGVLLSFSYVRTEGASLVLYEVPGGKYKVIWVSGNLDLQQEVASTSVDDWVTTSVCLSFDNYLEDKNEVKLSFVGHILPNSSIGLRQFKATVGVVACSVDVNTSLPNPTPSEPTDKAHVAWKVLVILSLFLCFGALFLATVVIVFGGFKNKFVRKNPRSRRDSEGQFVNPVCQFDYQRLQDM